MLNRFEKESQDQQAEGILGKDVSQVRCTEEICVDDEGDEMPDIAERLEGLDLGNRRLVIRGVEELELRELHFRPRIPGSDPCCAYSCRARRV